MPARKKAASKKKPALSAKDGAQLAAALQADEELINLDVYDEQFNELLTEVRDKAHPVAFKNFMERCVEMCNEETNTLREYMAEQQKLIALEAGFEGDEESDEAEFPEDEEFLEKAEEEEDEEILFIHPVPAKKVAKKTS